ncbi:MAG: hypothetical protein ACJA1L_002643 [Paracoccaceae bacterium]|jgi:hypothetical protein
MTGAPTPQVREEALRCLRAFAAVTFGPLPGGDPAPHRLTGPLPVPLTALLRLAEAEGVTEVVAAGLLARLGNAPSARALGLMLAPPRRLAQIRARAYAAELAELGGALVALGHRGVALKGAAVLAEAGSDEPPAWRDMIDLDLLIAPEALAPMVDALIARGWTGDLAAFSPASDYHFPALIPPGDAPATVELHLRLGWRRGGPLAAPGLMARAIPSAMEGLSVLAPPDRLAHLMMHAQIADRRHARGTARLRDALDWRMLAMRADPGAAPMPGRAARRGGQAFAALQALIWDAPETCAPNLARSHGAWARTALGRIGDAQAQDAAKARDRARFWLDTALSPALLWHLAAGMANPTRRARLLGRLIPGGAPRGD